MGLVDKESVQKGELLLDELGLEPEDRKVVIPARKTAEETEENKKGHDGIYCGAAIELKDGTIITGKNSELMHAASSLVMNAIKTLTKIPDNMHLLSPDIIKSIGSLKKDVLKRKAVSLDLEETMIALSISATTNPSAQAAMEKLKDLKGCEMHMTHIPTPGDEIGLKNLGVNNLTININDRQELFKTLGKAGIPQSKQLRATQIIDKLDKKDKQDVIKELAKAVDKYEAQSTFRLLDKQTKPNQSLAQIVKYAVKLGVPEDQLIYVPYLARGLDYYTGLIVEALIPDYKVGSVLGGGRFDNLIGQLSGDKVSLEAVGYSIGIDRTVEALDTLDLLPKQPSSAKILVTIFDKNLVKNSVALAAVLRDNGISTDLYPSLDVKLDKQLKYADKKSIPFVAIIGDNEAKAKTVTVKNMKTGDQKTASLDKLLPLLRS